MRHLIHCISLVILFLGVPLPLPLYAQSTHHTALVEGAKKEGKLVWYTSMAIDTSKPLLDAFLQEYPFIKPDLVRAGEEQLTRRWPRSIAAIRMCALEGKKRRFRRGQIRPNQG